VSIQSVQAALDVEGLPPGEKIVLVGLANHDGKGGCWPAIATLAKYSGVSYRHVQRLVSNLEDRGLVTVDRHAGGTAETRGDRRTNRYQLHLDGVTPRSPRDQSHEVTPESPREANGVTSSAPRDDTHVIHGVTPTSGEPSLNRPIEEPSPQFSDMTKQRAALLAAAGKMYTTKQIDRGVRVRSLEAFATARAAELEDQTSNLIDELIARITRCAAAGQSIDIEAHAAVLVDGVSARRHLSDVNPDPAQCTPDCQRCAGTSMYEPDAGAGYARCPGPLTAVGAA